MNESLEDRFRDMLVTALAVDDPAALAAGLADEAARFFRQLAVTVDASYPVTFADGPHSWQTESRPFAGLLPDGPEPPRRRPVFLASQDEQDALEAALDVALSSKVVDDLGLIEAPRQTVPLMRIRDQLRAPWLRTRHE